MFKINSRELNANGPGDGPHGIRVETMTTDLSYNDVSGNFFYDASGNDLSGNDIDNTGLIQGGSNVVTYFIGLNTKPTSDVAITLTQPYNNLSFNGDVNANNELTFTQDNYNIVQTVEIRSAIDPSEILASNPDDNVTLTATSDDPNYNYEEGKETLQVNLDNIETERLPKLIVTPSEIEVQVGEDTNFELEIRSNKEINGSLILNLQEESEYLSLSQYLVTLQTNPVTLQTNPVNVTVTISDPSNFDLKSFSDRVKNITISPNSNYVDGNTTTNFEDVEVRVTLNKKAFVDGAQIATLVVIASVAAVIAGFAVRALNGGSSGSKKRNKKLQKKKLNDELNNIKNKFNEITKKIKNL